MTSVKVGLRDIEYKKEYKGDELELQDAVEEHLYPPAIFLHILQSEVPRHLRLHKRILLHVRGTKKGAMNFPFYVFEEKEGVSCLCTCLMCACWHHFRCQFISHTILTLIM